MKGKISAGQSDEEFVRAADEVMRHIQTEHGCSVAAAVGTSVRRTVVTIRIVAHEGPVAAPERIRGAVQGEFPNSRAGTLAAYLYSLCVMLDHTLDAQDNAARN